MAAPEYVPVKPMDDVRAYESPPRRPDPWHADRPGDLDAGQPHGPRFGHPGPDQGYGLTLTRRFEGKLHLTPGEHEADALMGGFLVALKRASLFGRAPVIHDLTAAFTIWGFLDPDPPTELVALRKPLFEEVARPNHYLEQRRIVDATRADGLRQPSSAIAAQSKAGWRDLLDLS